MTWVCPYCGKENEQEERIGRREPVCKRCGEVRTDPEELEKAREKNIEDLKKEIGRINGRISPIVDEISSLEDSLSDLRIELSDLQSERAPLREDLKKWTEQQIFFEPRDRGFLAEQDPKQAKLPFEVPA